MRTKFTTSILKLSVYACVLVLVFMVISCDLFTYKRIFPDAYYDNNFIEHIDFSAFVKTDDVPEPDTTGVRVAPIGSWDFVYRYEHGWKNSFEYMSLERAKKTEDPNAEDAIVSDFIEHGLPSGLLESAPVFRLEMKNLIANGDFENIGMEAWNFQGTSSGQILENQINGKSATLSLDSNTPVSYSITPFENLIQENSNYDLFFKFIGSISKNQKVAILNSFASMQNNIGSVNFNATAENKLVFSSEGDAWNIIIDDITIKKKGGQKLRLLLAPQSTEPELIDLLYVFSFWVHPDPFVGAHTSPYMLDSLEPQMLKTDFSSISTETSSPFNSGVEGWQKINARVKNGNLMFPSETTEPVLELVIDLDKALPGRILIAQPELRAYPDGY